MKARLSLFVASVSLLSSQHVFGAAAAEEASLPAIQVSAAYSGASFNAKDVQVGTFRNASVLDVPQTSNVFTRDLLEAQGANGLYDVLRNTAGVTRDALSGSTYDNIALRGITVDNTHNYLLNGSLPIINLVQTPLENKERVEVLKGVSSLYYGILPPSGIVNFVTRRAGKTPNASVGFMVNQYGGASVHADLGQRFGEQQQFGARVNAVLGREDAGIERDSGQRAFLSGAFDFRASRELLLKFDLEHYRKNNVEQAGILIPAAVNGALALPAPLDNRRNLGGSWARSEAEANNMLLRADYLLDERWSVVAEAGRAQTDVIRNQPSFGFGAATVASGQGTLYTTVYGTRRNENRNYRLELNGTLPGELLTHEVSLGYTSNRYEQQPMSYGTSAQAQNLYAPLELAQSYPLLGKTWPASMLTDAGIYLSDRILIGAQWQAILGARYDNYRLESAGNASAKHGIAPSAALLYKLTPRASLYAGYSRGIENTGFAPYNAANAGQLLEPGVSRQTEAGVKYALLRDTLLQFACFDMTRASTAIDANNLFVLNGYSQYRGAEMSLAGSINEQWSLTASAMLMRARQLNQANASTYDKEPANTPKKTASMFAQYRLAGVPGLSLSGGLYYTGGFAVNNQNQAWVGGHTSFSAGVQYVTRLAQKRLTLQLLGDNIGNKTYWGAANNGLLAMGTPRLFALNAKLDL